MHAQCAPWLRLPGACCCPLGSPRIAPTLLGVGTSAAAMAAQMLESRKDSIGVHAAVCGEFRTVHWHSANSVSGCSGCMDAPLPGACLENTYHAELPPPLLLLAGGLGSCCSTNCRCRCRHSCRWAASLSSWRRASRRLSIRGWLLRTCQRCPACPCSSCWTSESGASGV